MYVISSNVRTKVKNAFYFKTYLCIYMCENNQKYNHYYLNGYYSQLLKFIKQNDPFSAVANFDSSKK